MNYTLKELLEEPKFKAMSVEELTKVIKYRIYFDDYLWLDGELAREKAEILCKKWKQ